MRYTCVMLRRPQAGNKKPEFDRSLWKSATDKATGATYFYNIVSRESRWTLPE